MYNATSGGYTYAGKDAYDRFLAPFISQWGVTQPADAAANGYCYYYKDYATQQIRLIVLDCMKYDSTQAAWLSDTLASARSAGYGVIIANHYQPGEITQEDCSFSIMGQETYSTSLMLSSEAAGLVDSFIVAGGEFICWIAGHAHKDVFGTLTSFPNQTIVLIERAGAFVDYTGEARVVGTKSQDAFNIMAVDRATHTIRIVRVGSDLDMYLRSKQFLSWNYQTCKLIANS